MKSIKVSEEVHEELSTRKHGGESFDQVLERELGLVPRTVEELTRMLPDPTKTAVNTLLHEHIDTDGRYKRIGRKDEEGFTLKFVSRETNKSIFEIIVSNLPVNHKAEINYRNPQNELENVLNLKHTEENAVDIEYRGFESREMNPNTRRGSDASRNTADLVGDDIQEFVNQSYEIWGVATEPQNRS